MLKRKDFISSCSEGSLEEQGRACAAPRAGAGPQQLPWVDGQPSDAARGS